MVPANTCIGSEGEAGCYSSDVCYSKPHIPDTECREGQGAGKGRDVGSQMKSFIR